MNKYVPVIQLKSIECFGSVSFFSSLWFPSVSDEVASGFNSASLVLHSALTFTSARHMGHVLFDCKSIREKVDNFTQNCKKKEWLKHILVSHSTNSLAFVGYCVA